MSPDERVKELSRLSDLDERTVWKGLAGGELRPSARRRLDRAIDALRALDVRKMGGRA